MTDGWIGQAMLVSTMGAKWRISRWWNRTETNIRTYFVVLGGFAENIGVMAGNWFRCSFWKVLAMSVEMTEEIKVKVIEYLQTFEQGIKKAGEFSAEQAPLVVQEFLAWEFWGNAVPAVLCLALLLTVAVTAITVFIKSRNSDYKFGAALFGTAIVVGLSLPTAVCGTQAMKAAIAPRVVLLEKISGLMQWQAEEWVSGARWKCEKCRGFNDDYSNQRAANPVFLADGLSDSGRPEDSDATGCDSEAGID